MVRQEKRVGCRQDSVLAHHQSHQRCYPSKFSCIFDDAVGLDIVLVEFLFASICFYANLDVTILLLVILLPSNLKRIFNRLSKVRKRGREVSDLAKYYVLILRPRLESQRSAMFYFSLIVLFG